MAPCLAFSRGNGNNGKSNKKAAVVRQGEKKRGYSGTALFCGNEGSHIRGEAGSRMYGGLPHTCSCADHGQ